jgi:hypothetical protein
LRYICIKVAGSDREPFDRAIQPDTTVEELLKDCGLRGYLLSLRNSTGYLAPGENLYAAVNDGDCLLATTPACEVY